MGRRCGRPSSGDGRPAGHRPPHRPRGPRAGRPGAVEPSRRRGPRPAPDRCPRTARAPLRPRPSGPTRRRVVGRRRRSSPGGPRQPGRGARHRRTGPHRRWSRRTGDPFRQSPPRLRGAPRRPWTQPRRWRPRCRDGRARASTHAPARNPPVASCRDGRGRRPPAAPVPAPSSPCANYVRGGCRRIRRRRRLGRPGAPASGRGRPGARTGLRLYNTLRRRRQATPPGDRPVRRAARRLVPLRAARRPTPGAGRATADHGGCASGRGSACPARGLRRHGPARRPRPAAGPARRRVGARRTARAGRLAGGCGRAADGDGDQPHDPTVRAAAGRGTTRGARRLRRASGAAGGVVADAPAGALPQGRSGRVQRRGLARRGPPPGRRPRSAGRRGRGQRRRRPLGARGPTAGRLGPGLPATAVVAAGRRRRSRPRDRADRRPRPRPGWRALPLPAAQRRWRGAVADRPATCGRGRGRDCRAQSSTRRRARGAANRRTAPLRHPQARLPRGRHPPRGPRPRRGPRPTPPPPLAAPTVGRPCLVDRRHCSDEPATDAGQAAGPQGERQRPACIVRAVGSRTTRHSSSRLGGRPARQLCVRRQPPAGPPAPPAGRRTAPPLPPPDRRQRRRHPTRRAVGPPRGAAGYPAYGAHAGAAPAELGRRRGTGRAGRWHGGPQPGTTCPPVRGRRVMISPQRRREIIDALRRGTVPQRGLDAFAVGTERFAAAFDDELAMVATGGAGFKAVRGEYGSGKTFVVRWLAERARTQGFATAEVQISERETPLHHLEAVYRRLCERLTTADTTGGALRAVVDSWFFALHEDVVAAGTAPAGNAEAVLEATDTLAEQRLGAVATRAPALAAVLRGYRRALADDDNARAEGLLAWLGGQPHVAASVKRAAGIRGDLDHDAALAFLAGLLTILRGAGYAGLVFVLDEVETVQRLAPLAQRLHTDFTTDARFDSPRAVQLRLAGFTVEGLGEVGRRTRDLYADGAADPNRIRSLCDDDYIALLAKAVTGDLGGRVGVAPRVFLKKLVGDILDRIDQFPDFNPRPTTS